MLSNTPRAYITYSEKTADQREHQHQQQHRLELDVGNRFGGGLLGGFRWGFMAGYQTYFRASDAASISSSTRNRRTAPRLHGTGASGLCAACSRLAADRHHGHGQANSSVFSTKPRLTSRSNTWPTVRV